MPDITFGSPARALDGYLAIPGNDYESPGVVVIHDVGGLTSEVRRCVDRLAAAGFITLAPNLIHPGARIRCVRAMARSLRFGTGPAVDDIIAARDHLSAHAGCTGKVGVVGFCMGGGFCLLLAPQGFFEAAAPNYGNWPPDPEALRNSCPIVASYGAKDISLKGAADRLRSILVDGGVPHDVKEYPGVGHSFMNDWRDASLRLRVFEYIPGFAFSQPAADDAWRRIISFFDVHLRDGGRPTNPP